LSNSMVHLNNLCYVVEGDGDDDVVVVVVVVVVEVGVEIEVEGLMFDYELIVYVLWKQSSK